MWVNQREYKRLGRVLKKARKETDADLTQGILAERLSKPQSFVSSYESGQRRVDLLEFLKIIEAIGADPKAVFARILAEFVPAKAKPKRR